MAGSIDSNASAVSESSIVLTGSNRIVASSAGKPNPGKYSAGILSATTAMGRPGTPATGIFRVYYEGTIDASGTGMVGVQSIIPIAVLKMMGVSKSYVTVIGDVNLSSSDSDALYAECVKVSDPSRYDMISEIYVRGNVTITDGRDSGAGVSALGSTVIVDGDISVSGTDGLFGVYADRNATVLVTGEITAPVTVRIPEDESAANRNDSKVYIWKGSDTCTGKTEQIGYVIKVSDGFDAEVSGGSSFISIEREGRTYYGAGASDTVTVRTARDDFAVFDAFGNALSAEKTDGGFTFTMPADCGVLVTHEGHSCDRYEDMVWSKDYSSAHAVFSCAGCDDTVSVPAVVACEVTEDPTSPGKSVVVYTATVTYEGETYTAVVRKTGTAQTGRTDSPETPAENPADTRDTDWIFTSLAAGRKFNREQLAAILYRYAGFRGYDVSIDENTNYLSYNDVFDIAECARLPMFWSVENDMIFDTDGDLRHAEPALRWEVAAAIRGFCENVGK